MPDRPTPETPTTDASSLDDVFGPTHRLRRSRTDCYVAGVAGGVGEHFGVDPLLVRIAFVALTLVGGAGLTLYALAWLFIPMEGHRETEGSRLLRRFGSNHVVVAIVAVVVGISLIDWLGQGHHGVLAAVALLAIGAALFHAPSRLTPTAPADRPAIDWSLAASAPALPVRRRSVAGPAVVATIVVIGAALITWLTPMPNLSLRNLVFLGLVGAVAGAVIARSRALAVLAALLLLSLGALAPIGGGVGNRVWQPEGRSDIHGAYRLAIGDGTVDLGHVALGEGSTTVRASVGIGHLLVLVPKNAVVRVHAESGAGKVDLFGESTHGVGVDRTLTTTDGRSGRLVLDVQIGVGDVEVRRAA